jgi:hypothetical protein
VLLGGLERLAHAVDDLGRAAQRHRLAAARLEARRQRLPLDPFERQHVRAQRDAEAEGGGHVRVPDLGGRADRRLERLLRPRGHVREAKDAQRDRALGLGVLRTVERAEGVLVGELDHFEAVQDERARRQRWDGSVWHGRAESTT